MPRPLETIVGNPAHRPADVCQCPLRGLLSRLPGGRAVTWLLGPDLVSIPWALRSVLVNRPSREHAVQGTLQDRAVAPCGALGVAGHAVGCPCCPPRWWVPEGRPRASASPAAPVWVALGRECSPNAGSREYRACGETTFSAVLFVGRDVDASGRAVGFSGQQLVSPTTAVPRRMWRRRDGAGGQRRAGVVPARPRGGLDEMTGCGNS